MIACACLRAEDARQHHRCSRRRVDRQRPHFANRPAQEQRHRVYGAIRPDADAGHDAVARSIEIRDRRHHAEIDLAIRQQPRALGRRIESQTDEIVPPLETEHERPDVQIVDSAEPDQLHLAVPVSYLPFRSTGVATTARI